MLRALFALALLALGVGGYAAWTLTRAFDAPGPAPRETRILVQRGETPAGVAERLEREGVIEDALVFRILVRLEDQGGRIRAGEYMAPAAASPRAVLALLTDGPTIARRLTVPEGAAVREALAIVAAAEGLTGDAPTNVPEGALLPETYHYAWGDTREAMVDRMRRAMDAALAEGMASLPEDHPAKTPLQLLTLASIVEKETGVPEERPRVAAVFVNRLKRSMMLQSDPTTIYAITRGEARLDRALTYDDLKLDDPYNTYARAGLPPGPIALPGKAAIMAAARPAETDELYFVADGTGGHAFARSLREHNRNVRAWRAIQRQGDKR